MNRLIKYYADTCHYSKILISQGQNQFKNVNLEKKLKLKKWRFSVVFCFTFTFDFYASYMQRNVIFLYHDNYRLVTWILQLYLLKAELQFTISLTY